MPKRAGIHDDQWRMDDWTGIHQGAGEGVAAIFDDVGKGAAQYGQRMVLADEREDAGGRALRPRRDRCLERCMPSRKPG